MRTLQEIQNEYTTTCAQLGDLEVKAQGVLAQVEAQKKPLLDKVASLQKEAEQRIILDNELLKKENEAKQTAEEGKDGQAEPTVQS